MLQHPTRPLRPSALALLAVAAALLAPALLASDSPLSTDRPGVGNSPLVVPRGTIQLESGIGLATIETGGPDVDVTTLFDTLLRWGLTESLELRTGFAGLIDVDIDGLGGDDGVGDTSAGLKWTVRDGGDGGPAIGMILATTLPTGDDGFGAEEAEPSLFAALAHPLSDRAELAYNVGLLTRTETDPFGDEDRLGVGAASATLGGALGARVGGFVEIAATWPLAAGGGPATVADAGLTFAVGDRMQLDVTVGTGLSDAAEGSFFGAGFVYRWDRD